MTLLLFDDRGEKTARSGCLCPYQTRHALLRTRMRGRHRRLRLRLAYDFTLRSSRDEWVRKQLCRGRPVLMLELKRLHEHVGSFRRNVRGHFGSAELPNLLGQLLVFHAKDVRPKAGSTGLDGDIP